MKKKRKQSEAKIRVLLVDDHAGMRDALRTFINSEPDLTVVAEADCARRIQTHDAGRGLNGRLDAWKEWNRGHP
jgi:PleD family two-component response regulator